jgi:hypothetical protein
MDDRVRELFARFVRGGLDVHASIDRFYRVAKLPTFSKRKNASGRLDP